MRKILVHWTTTSFVLIVFGALRCVDSAKCGYLSTQVRFLIIFRSWQVKKDLDQNWNNNEAKSFFNNSKKIILLTPHKSAKIIIAEIIWNLFIEKYIFSLTVFQTKNIDLLTAKFGNLCTRQSDEILDGFFLSFKTLWSV